MTTTPPPDDQEARTQRHLACLDTLIALGMDLAKRVHQQSTRPAEPGPALAEPGPALAEPGATLAAPGPALAAPDAALAAPDAATLTPETIALFEKINLTVRRAILVSRKLAEPLPQAPVKPAPARPPVDRIAIRKRIIREVEDTIHRKADAAEAEILRAELCERVETCDFDDDIGTRPDRDIVLDICRDLGVSSDFPANCFKRRTPQELRTLNARAAAPRPPDPAPQNPGDLQHGPAAPKSKHPSSPFDRPPRERPPRERPQAPEQRPGT